MPLMPINKEQRRPRHAAVRKGAGEPRQPRWLLPVAVAFCAMGVLVGVLLSAGAFVPRGDSDVGTPVGAGQLATAVATTDSASADATAGASGGASPTTPGRAPVQPSSTPTGSSSPTDAPATPTPVPILLPPEESDPQPVVWILRSVMSSLCLDVVTEQQEGADVQQVECADAPRQQWQATDVKPEDEAVTVTLVNVASGKCLDVEQFLWLVAVEQRTCKDGEPGQRWRVEEAGPDSVRLVAVHSGKCLGVPSKKSGAKVTVSKCDEGNKQHWALR